MPLYHLPKTGGRQFERMQIAKGRDAHAELVDPIPDAYDVPLTLILTIIKPRQSRLVEIRA